jgi:hypothetical protein
MSGGNLPQFPIAVASTFQMINKIFSVATFILVAWLSVTLTSTSNKVVAIERSLSGKIDNNYQALRDRIGTLENDQQSGYEEVLASFKETSAKPAVDPQQLNALKAETGKLKAQIQQLGRLKDLKSAYRQVLEAELDKANDGTAAAEKLLATKGAIWKASTQHESVKGQLQGLMGPIDSLASKWKGGDTGGSVQPIYNVLKQTLATLDAK